MPCIKSLPCAFSGCKELRSPRSRSGLCSLHGKRASALRYWEYHKKTCKEWAHQWQTRNRERAKELLRNWRHKNPDRVKKAYGIAGVLRTRLNCALKDGQKAGSAVKDLGCSVDEFKAYLGSQFQPGMTWENYGRSGWSIDHVVPLSCWNLSDRGQLLAACNYRNLRPMWARDNIAKKNRITDEVKLKYEELKKHFQLPNELMGFKQEETNNGR